MTLFVKYRDKKYLVLYLSPQLKLNYNFFTDIFFEKRKTNNLKSKVIARY